MKLIHNRACVLSQEWEKADTTRWKFNRGTVDVHILKLALELGQSDPKQTRLLGGRVVSTECIVPQE